MGQWTSSCCGRGDSDESEYRPLLDDPINVDPQRYSGILEQDALKSIVQNAAESFFDISSTHPNAVEKMLEHGDRFADHRQVLNAITVYVEDSPVVPVQLRVLADGTPDAIMITTALHKIQEALAQIGVVHKEPVVVSFM